MARLDRYLKSLVRFGAKGVEKEGQSREQFVGGFVGISQSILKKIFLLQRLDGIAK